MARLTLGIRGNLGNSCPDTGLTEEFPHSECGLFEVLFYDGYQQPPVYYLIDGITGETPEQALADNLEAVTEKVREVLHLDSYCTDHFIHQSLFVLPPGGLGQAGKPVIV